MIVSSRTTAASAAAANWLSFTFVVSRTRVSGGSAPTDAAASSWQVNDSRPITRSPSRAMASAWPGRAMTVTA